MYIYINRVAENINMPGCMEHGMLFMQYFVSFDLSIKII